MSNARESAQPCGCDAGCSPAHVCEHHRQAAEQTRVITQQQRPNFTDAFGRVQDHYGDPLYRCGCGITGSPVYCADHQHLSPLHFSDHSPITGSYSIAHNVRPVHSDTFCDVYAGPGEAPVTGIKDPLPKHAADRKTYPIATGVMDYFPLAIAEVAHVSYQGNQQHHPDKPLHWDRSKSTDEADALMRHFLQRGTSDTDGIRHSAKVAWRALAALEKELEGAK